MAQVINHPSIQGGLLNTARLGRLRIVPATVPRPVSVPDVPVLNGPLGERIQVHDRYLDVQGGHLGDGLGAFRRRRGLPAF